MVLKSNISITQFLFTLEEFLLENRVISNRRELEWNIVEYYKNLVIRDLSGDFKLDKKQFLSFTKNYNQRRRIFEKYKHNIDLDPLKVLLRQARDAPSTPQTGALHQAAERTSPTSQTGAPYQAVEQTRPRPPAEQPSGDAERPSGEVPLQAPFDSEKVCKLLSKLVDEVADLKVEFRDLEQQVLANLPSRGEYGLRQPRVDDVLPSIEQAPVVAEHTSPASKAESTTESARSLYNQVLQSVGSKRPFVRARQRVALCTLYISGFTIANMQRLTVGHLKQLRQFAHGGCATAPFPLRLLPSVSIELVASIIVELDIIISDVSNETPAFRTHPIKARHCPRESLTKELNQILGSFQLSTQSWRAMP
ncbi:MAG: hypothetical protein OIF51_14715 [Cellvibrionaceae bacterium]|nr:hypothetical protein [Cellvibrionaceae bacterium]